MSYGELKGGVTGVHGWCQGDSRNEGASVWGVNESRLGKGLGRASCVHVCLCMARTWPKVSAWPEPGPKCRPG